MRYYQLSALALLTFITLGCSNTPLLSQETQIETKQEVAILADYELKDGFITIQAVGYGCTFFNSFKVAVADKDDNALEVIRTRPDDCGMKPRNVSLQYSFKHLGLDLNKQVQVKNPVETTENPRFSVN
ncbi:hypothetical protein [Aliikangiella coralliicola]|uniref:Lipoprotein n=1 Tax=Aliikangiella coralliicola TaxID=2592383 RepID=A0A545UBQ4_9GAMM|nr:hypothetical protein [Aliikangiella coralliicola]TQV86896.1 hypothetical protein FLL46_13850 [Aliikangiella coralliicola]